MTKAARSAGSACARPHADRGYSLGARLLSLAGRASDDSDLARAARPALRALCERTGYAIHFGVRNGDEVAYVDKLEGRRAYRMRSRIGLTVPLHCTAIGKAILAALPDEEVRMIVHRTGLPRRTPHTCSSIDALLANLATTRARGWAAHARRPRNPGVSGCRCDAPLAGTDNR